MEPNRLRFLQIYRLYFFRFDDGEVQRFWSAAHGDTAKFVRSVRNTIGWRQRYQFLSEADLKVWKHLVFWHKSDAHGRPTLIIRLGLAYTALTPSERPLFAQAIGVSLNSYNVSFSSLSERILFVKIHIVLWMES